MHKIPVVRTIAFAYRFLIREIGIVLGICWLPALMFSGANYLTRLYAIENRAGLEINDPQTEGALFLLTVLSLAATLYASSVVAVGITRQVMGHERPPGVLLLYFAAGRSEWRMLGAYILFMLAAVALIVAAAFVAALAFLIAGAPLTTPERMMPTAANIVAAFVAWTALLSAFVGIVQVGFLLPPAVVMDEKGGLRRTYELAKGNVWRLVAITIALGLPILLLVAGAEAAIVESALGPNAANLSPTEFLEKAGQAMEQKLGAWQIFSAIMFILGSGLIYSGAAFAYRERTSPEAER
jgi:hypothetical protein